jgi:hypothetical protein
MTPPRRWLDDAEGSSDAEREMLRAGLSLEPPAGAEGAVWASLLAKLPPGGLPPSPSGSTAGAKAAAGKAAAAKATTAAVSGGVLKAALIGAGSAVVVLAGYAAVAPSAPEPPPPAPVVAASQAPRAVAPEPRAPSAAPAVAPSAEPSSEPPAERRPEPRAPSAAPVASAAPSSEPPAEPAVERETLLREESRLVGEAREALRAGHAADALAQLEQIRTRFPGGVLTQEREALAIESLARSGQRAEAAARAAAFVKAYPTSPLAARVQAFAN